MRWNIPNKCLQVTNYSQKHATQESLISDEKATQSSAKKRNFGQVFLLIFKFFADDLSINFVFMTFILLIACKKQVKKWNTVVKD